MFFRRKKKKTHGEHSSELRTRYRRVPGKGHALGVQLKPKDEDAVSGEVVDVSAGGAAVRFNKARDPEFKKGKESRLAFSSLVHGGEVLVDVRVARVGTPVEGGRTYGFEFLGVDELFAQLDSYYFNFFNRRRKFRVRPALDSRLPLTIHRQGEELKVFVSDLSEIGMGFTLNKESAALLEGVTEFEATFEIPKSASEIHCAAQIAHKTERKKGTLCGVAIMLPEDAKIQREILRDYVKKREDDIARWDSAYE